MLQSVDLIDSSFSIQSESFNGLHNVWQSIYIDKELPPPPKTKHISEVFPGRSGRSFQSMVENGKNQNKTTTWLDHSPPFSHSFLSRDISRAAVKSITYQSLLQGSYFRIKLLHLQIFT